MAFARQADAADGAAAGATEAERRGFEIAARARRCLHFGIVPGPGEILMRIEASGICGSDVECFEGLSSEGRYDIGPYTPGHEWGGKIIEVGSQVKHLKPEMKVTGDCVMACGVCHNCKDGLMPSACQNMREAGFTVPFETARMSAGLEFRFHLPIFPVPLRLIYGFPIRELQFDRTNRFQFSIGRSF